MRSIAAGILVAALALATPAHAHAQQPRADVTPGCVDLDEFDRAYWVETKAQVEQRLHARGELALFAGEVDFNTGDVYLNHSPRYVKFIYPACTGLMYVIYERPNRYHPTTRVWVQMRYQETEFSRPRVTR